MKVGIKMFKRKVLLCALIPFTLAGCKPKENKTRELSCAIDSIYSFAIFTISLYGLPSTIVSPIAQLSSIVLFSFCAFKNAYIFIDTSAFIYTAAGGSNAVTDKPTSVDAFG